MVETCSSNCAEARSILVETVPDMQSCDQEMMETDIFILVMMMEEVEGDLFPVWIDGNKLDSKIAILHVSMV
jgi:hypothetical protein